MSGPLTGTGVGCPVHVLVTGGAGFIGSHLCHELLRRGLAVSAFDNFSTGARRNLSGLLDHPAFLLLEGDVCDAAQLRRAFQGDRPPDLVFHLAAAVGVRTILDFPLTSLETNLHGTQQVLALAADSHADVVIASTSEVYGKNDRGPLAEEADRTIGSGDLARWWYAVAKMADEALALAYHREGRLRAMVVRLFNTVGPRQTGRYGMVLPTLVGQALAGQPLTVYGDGDQTRCFTYVLDTVRALADLAALPHAFGQVFNVGQPQEISINQLAQRILHLTDSRSAVTHIPYLEAYGQSFEDMRRRVPDCSLLARTLGVVPTDRLDEAILAVADDVRAQALDHLTGDSAAAR